MNMAASIIGSLPTKVQTGEKFRLDLTRTYTHVSEHSIGRIDVTIDATTYDVTTEKYFDFDFSTTGTKTISVEVELSGQGHPLTNKDFTIEVVSASDEKLFSTDDDLTSHEPQILEYMPEGRGCYKYVHRLAQSMILAGLDEMGIHDDQGEKLTIDDVIDITEFKQLSKYMSLRLVFESLSNQVDDIFHFKYRRYYDFEKDAWNRVKIRMDLDNDGNIDDKVRNLTRGMFRA